MFFNTAQSPTALLYKIQFKTLTYLTETCSLDVCIIGLQLVATLINPVAR